MAWTRRDFLALAGALASVATTEARAQRGGLGDFTMSGPACSPDVKPTPALPAMRTFRRGAPLRTSLVEPGAAATPLVLAGTVAGVTCGRIRDAEVEIWHPDNAGAFDGTGFRYRGRQLTNAQGQFTFQTIVPGEPPGRTRHVGLHVRVPGRAELWTELFFPGEPGNALDPRFRQELVMTMRAEGRGRAAHFDVLLNL